MIDFDVDIAIVGGGVGGLWLLNRLLARGYNAALFESAALGGGQSINSQGMIHGGIKYALGGALTGSSEAIADMPEHWRRCLRNEGDVDLRGVKLLSDHFYLWSSDNIASRLTSFFASKLTRGRVETVAAANRHQIFQNPSFRGNLYKLVDMVLDVPSLIEKLRDNAAGRIFALDAASINFERAANGNATALRATNDSVAFNCRAQRFVFSAGEGNETLLEKLGSDKPEMQRRPLHQALVKHDYPHPLYAHCTGGNPSPRLTISSHPLRDGKWVWYLGGDLATENIDASAGELIDKAKRELADLFPWVNFGHTEWATLRIDRAEPKQKGLLKPDKAFAARAAGANNVIVAWPTKLTLAPNMADEVDQLLDAQLLDVKKPPQASLPVACNEMKAPPLAQPCWELLF
ncbi:MAG: glycerol-3-phosphate dehydrogenase [Verrucomicrobiaceae bacterium]|nr:glycerol-3-phosphate dehydrogenase [Verrucomicrobiaceae bacterium]